LLHKLLLGLLSAGLVQTVVLRAAPEQIRGVEGTILKPFEPTGRVSVIFFVATDCPISNAYAPEIQRICREYGPKGAECFLIYEDVPPVSEPRPGRAGAGRQAAVDTPRDDEVRRHLSEYRYAGIPAAVDRTRAIATRGGASRTPQVVVVDRTGAIRYRGRIDNFYAALGVSRQQVTERDLRRALDAIFAGRPVPVRETEAVGCHIVDPAILRIVMRIHAAISLAAAVIASAGSHSQERGTPARASAPAVTFSETIAPIV
jgi:thiol-disulfide isomerase/thioredoxin